MKRYFFVPGRNPALSLSELIFYLHSRSINHRLISHNRNIVILEIDDPAVGEIFVNLGGFTKFGEIVGEIKWDEPESKLEKYLDTPYLNSYLKDKNRKKLRFGISLYDLDADEKITANLDRQINSLSLSIKENLANQGIKSGFVQRKEKEIKSVSVAKNIFREGGFELTLIPSRECLYLGKTENVQDFAAFTLRDFFRPKKDKRVGIMPVKLARIMINLADPSKEGVLLDPFCGGGTILSEALILGIKKIIGSDLSPQAIADARQNLDWLVKTYRLNEKDFQLKFLQSDVRQLSQHFKTFSVDSIVSEPHLGPPLNKKPNINQIQHTTRELENLYLAAFQEFNRIIKKDGRIVFILPIFNTDKGKVFINLKNILSLGFVQILLPMEVLKLKKHELSSRSTLIYSGRDNFLEREILIVKKM